MHEISLLKIYFFKIRYLLQKSSIVTLFIFFHLFAAQIELLYKRKIGLFEKTTGVEDEILPEKH